MRRLKISLASTTLRVGIVLGLAVIFLAAASVGVLQGTFVATAGSNMTAEQGFLDLRGSELLDDIAYLNGEWEYYPNVFEVSDQFDARLLNSPQTQFVKMPISKVGQAVGPATYRLRIATDRPFTGHAFYLEHYSEDFAIYVNGQRAQPIKASVQGQLLLAMTDTLFYVPGEIDTDVVEIIISANSNRAQALLYRNGVIVGPMQNTMDYVARVWRDNTFLIGMILVVVSIGLVFVLMRTQFDMLTTIALFDSLLAIRILLGYNVATYFISHLLPWLRLDAVDFVKLQYVAFFLTGAFGCLLSQSIFDVKKELPIWPIKAQIAFCISGSAFTLLFFRQLSGLCIAMLMAVLLGSFLIVTWHVWQYIKKQGLSAYIAFQIIKTYYVGGIMILDIVYQQSTSYNAFVYAYVIFLLAHLAARIMDSNASYLEVEKLNHNLEQMIVERTSELTETNRSLSELSVRDPLTQSHNRLYFAQCMEEALTKQPPPLLYLCMFDLDHFKAINDRFGHVTGDEQLKFVVREANKILGDRGVFSRIGGEEFAIIFENQSKTTVLSIVEQIRRCLDEDAKRNEKRTTASFGLAQRNEGSTAKEIMQAADRCLYSAKKLGRNCIVVE